jgi:hypothetical protein
MNELQANSAETATEIAEDEADPGQEGVHRVNIRIAIGSMNMVATLKDNPTALDFFSLLPLTLTLRDFSVAEKVSGTLPKRLSEEGSPATDAGTMGDIAYYAPWGNIAFYRGNGPNASGVIKIARITSGVKALSQPGLLSVTISRAD